MKNIFTLLIITFLLGTIFASCQKQTVTNTVYIKDTSIVNTTVKRDSVAINDSTTIRDTTMVTDTSYHGGGIVGLWAGNFGSAGYNPTSQFSFLFRNDGTMRVYIYGTDTANATYAVDGVYQLIGYSVATQFVVGGNLYSTLGTVDSNFIFYQGTIGQGLNTTGFAIDNAHK